jgi:hypothetical protein
MTDLEKSERLRAALIERNKVLGTALQEIVKACGKYALTDSFEIQTIALKALGDKAK